MHPLLQFTGGHRNLPAAFRSTVGSRASGRALSWYAADHTVSVLTWGEYGERVERVAAALRAVGVQPGDRVGILSENRYEWLLADVGILAAGAVTVAPHAPLTAAQVQFQLRDAEVSWLFVSGREQLAKVEQVGSALPHLRGVVTFDPNAASGDVESWPRFLARGKGGEVLAQTAVTTEPHDLAGILYTSGTTGNPKGVMLTHGNLLSNAHALLLMSPFEPDDLLLSWLPYTHIYSRTVDHYKSLLGGLHLFLAPSAEEVPGLLPKVQPTHMASVPRLYEKILNAVAGATPRETAERLQSLVGPRRKWFSSGGAPLSRELAESFFRSGVPVLQGYGLTESSPVITFNHPGAYRLETVGKPLAGVEVAISADGEILTRGPHVMKGYWKNPEATAAVIRDGWLATGDLGTLDADGFLTITGRKKEMLVLSNGKKIAPTNLEGLLVADPLIEQVMICGEGRNFVTALIVPSWEKLRHELQAQGVDTVRSSEQLACCPLVEQFLARRIEQRLRDVSPGEQVRRFVLLAEPFSVAREELTVSLKLRREVILQHHRELISALYQDG